MRPPDGGGQVEGCDVTLGAQTTTCIGGDEDLLQGVRRARRRLDHCQSIRMEAAPRPGDLRAVYFAGALRRHLEVKVEDLAR